VRKNISPSELSGPGGILTAGYMVAEKGTTRLVWFLSIISANLAVMNFLPIPIVDGGLFTFLIIEKIKGSPISPRVQAIAQVVGLALLLSVFLFATYQDVFVRLPVMLR
jgi:regulator of sigma E protease